MELNINIAACFFLPGVAGILGFGTLIMYLPGNLHRAVQRNLGKIPKDAWLAQRLRQGEIENLFNEQSKPIQ